MICYLDWETDHCMFSKSSGVGKIPVGHSIWESFGLDFEGCLGLGLAERQLPFHFLSHCPSFGHPYSHLVSPSVESIPHRAARTMLQILNLTIILLLRNFWELLVACWVKSNSFPLVTHSAGLYPWWHSPSLPCSSSQAPVLFPEAWGFPLPSPLLILVPLPEASALDFSPLPVYWNTTPPPVLGSNAISSMLFLHIRGI